jgi:class 3 adenylate cyclase
VSPVLTQLRMGSVAIMLALPAAGLGLLTAKPHLEMVWEDHRAHFWLVLAASALSAVLAYATHVTAQRRGDARVSLVSLAFLAAAGFLALHALATPGVVLDASNAGFALATPVGLLIAAGFAALSSVERTTMRCSSLWRWLLLAVMAAWGAASLLELPPFSGASVPERASGSLIGIAVVGCALYAVAVVRYAALARRRPSSLLVLMLLAWVLLAEAMVAMAIGLNWHTTWWEWHALMLVAFGLIAWGAHRQWHEERFSDLYLDATAAGEREVSIVFADLQGFTSFSERHTPREVSRMLNTYFGQTVPPVVKRYGGEIDRIIGDALMVTFNRRGDQPDHAQRAAGAALAILESAERVAAAHPDWPRFRVGVNSGRALVGVLGSGGGRTHTIVGDTVNVAARLEAQAPVGGVAIGPETARRLDGATLEPLGLLHVKGREEPLAAQRLLAISDG